MPRGYMEGPAAEEAERLAEEAARVKHTQAKSDVHAAVYASTEDDPSPHFIGWLADTIRTRCSPQAPPGASPSAASPPRPTSRFRRGTLGQTRIGPRLADRRGSTIRAMGGLRCAYRFRLHQRAGLVCSSARSRCASYPLDPCRPGNRLPLLLRRGWPLEDKAGSRPHHDGRRAAWRIHNEDPLARSRRLRRRTDRRDGARWPRALPASIFGNTDRRR